MLDKLIWVVFNTQLVVYLFCVIGALATLTWIWDNFASLVCILKTFLLPYFIPSDGYTLAEKFGNWAGKDWNSLLISGSYFVSRCYIIIQIKLKEKVLNSNLFYGDR